MMTRSRHLSPAPATAKLVAVLRRFARGILAIVPHERPAADDAPAPHAGCAHASREWTAASHLGSTSRVGDGATAWGARALRGALAVTLACLLGIASPLCFPVAAHAAYPPIVTVPDNQFAPEGYDWSFEFTSVVSENGFVYVEDLQRHYSRLNLSRPDEGYFDCVKDGDSGYAAFISRNGSATNSDGSAKFALRFQGGTYQDTAIDAVMTITGWDVTTPNTGWARYWMQYDTERYIPDIEPGVFYNLGYTNDYRYRTQTEHDTLTNINLYTLGIEELSVSIEFVYAGTNVPIRVGGHLTSIDMDCQQAIAFDGAVDRVEVSESSAIRLPDSGYYLKIDDEGRFVYGGGAAIAADNSDGNYNKGLVGAYFDTADGDTVDIVFKTPWTGSNDPGRGGQGAVAMSFFALTPEYIASPSIDECGEVAKSVDATSPVQIGDTVTYRVELTVPVEGVTCRRGYRYTDLRITDEISEHLAVDPSSVRMHRDAESLASGAGAFTQDGSNGTVEFTFADSYLSTCELTGQTYAIEYEATVVSAPPRASDGRCLIPNDAVVVVNGTGELWTNVVQIEVDYAEPRDVAVTKRISAADVYWHHGDPAFLFELSGADANGVARTYRALASFSGGSVAEEDGYYVAHVLFKDVPVGVYTLTERDAVRYELERIDANGTVEGSSVVFDLEAIEQPAATFTNVKTTNYGGSDSTSVINSFKA